MVFFLDAVAFFFMASNGFIGFKRGFIEELGRFLGLLFSSMIALNLYISIGTILAGILPVDPWAVFILCFITIFLVALFCMRLMTKLIHFMFLSSNTKLVNKILGSFFGFTKGALLVMIFFWVFELMPNSNFGVVVINNSVAAKKMVDIRKNIISIFNWNDPVMRGESAINDFLKKMDAQNE